MAGVDGSDGEERKIKQIGCKAEGSTDGQIDRSI